MDAAAIIGKACIDGLLIELRRLFEVGTRHGVAAHARSRLKGKHTTLSEHMPAAHRAHMEWTPGRLLNWGASIGPGAETIVNHLLTNRPHPEMGYRSCLGIIRLADQYSPARMEAAAERALLMGACRYQSVKSILKNALDQQPLGPPPMPPTPPPPHDNIRGAQYFE